jgi:hypothetical protein
MINEEGFLPMVFQPDSPAHDQPGMSSGARSRFIILLLFLLWAPQALAGPSVPAAGLPDAPERPRPAQAPSPQDPASYASALKTWRSIQDINDWIGRRFVYDMERALKLSETQRAAGPGPAILTPEEFYARPQGVCVDLARFAKETADRIFPRGSPRYLMIEFAPVKVKRNVLRLHWLVIFQKDGAVYSFADSRRPGHMAGPFGSLEELVKGYEKYRGRRIVSYKALSDFRKKAAAKKRRERAQ